MKTLYFKTPFFLIFIILFMGIFSSCAQKTPYKNILFIVEGEVSDYFNGDLKLTDVDVQIIQKNNVIYSQKTNMGKYVLRHKMDVSVPFFIQFSKNAYLTKRIEFRFLEDSLKKVAVWTDSMVPFNNLDISLPFAEPFFNKMKTPIVVAEFSLANKSPILNVQRAEEVKKMMLAAIGRHSGTEKYTFANGKPRAILNFSNGLLNGECYWWEENGEIISKGTYVNGVKQTNIQE